MSMSVVTARRNPVHRISKLLLRGGEFNLTPWQFLQAQSAIDLLEEERFTEGERTMSEAELPGLYEPASYVAKEPIELQRLIDRLAARAPPSGACAASRPHVAACCHWRVSLITPVRRTGFSSR